MMKQKGRLLLLAIVAGAATSMTPVLNRLILSDAIPCADRGLLCQVAILSMMFGIVTAVLSAFLAFAFLQQRYIDYEQTLGQVFRHTLSLSPAAIRAFVPGDLWHRLFHFALYKSDINNRIALLIAGTVIALPAFVQMFIYIPRAAWCFSIYLLLSFIAHILVYRRGSANMALAQQAEGEFFGLLTRFINGIVKIRAACAEDSCFTLLSQVYNRVCVARQTHSRTFFLVGLFSLVTTAVALLLTYLVSVDLHGTPDAPTAGDCIAFVTASGIVSSICPLAFSAFEGICQYLHAKRRVKPILDATPEEVGGEVTAAPAGDIEMLHVSFSYDGRHKTLDDVSIRARPGEVIAIVGPSGAGKSTLIRLLLGFDRPEEGEIHYDGIDLRNRNVRSLRRHMGVVMQNASASPTSILRNILGNSTDLTTEDAWAAAEAASVADDIRAMPMGIQTILSSTSVSGGQRQRILIARALVRKPKILIFDEATSALDNISQRNINRTLISQVGVTEIIVAHRLSTIRAADRIYVLNHGRVVEEGSYDDLLAKGGLFTELAKRQLTEG